MTDYAGRPICCWRCGSRRFDCDANGYRVCQRCKRSEALDQWVMDTYGGTTIYAALDALAGGEPSS